MNWQSASGNENLLDRLDRCWNRDLRGLSWIQYRTFQPNPTSRCVDPCFLHDDQRPEMLDFVIGWEVWQRFLSSHKQNVLGLIRTISRLAWVSQANFSTTCVRSAFTCTASDRTITTEKSLTTRWYYLIITRRHRVTPIIIYNLVKRSSRVARHRSFDAARMRLESGKLKILKLLPRRHHFRWVKLRRKHKVISRKFERLAVRAMFH